MKDRTVIIFGNQIDAKTVRQAVKSKAKFIRKYGDDTAADYKKLFCMRPREFSALAAEQGFLFYQAHPFRNNMKITAPELLTGIEIKNGNPRHDSRNDIAKLWAEKFGMHMIAGSDCHRQEDVGVSGIVTEREVKDINDLISVLLSDDYVII